MNRNSKAIGLSLVLLLGAALAGWYLSMLSNLPNNQGLIIQCIGAFAIVMTVVLATRPFRRSSRWLFELKLLGLFLVSETLSFGCIAVGNLYGPNGFVLLGYLLPVFVFLGGLGMLIREVEAPISIKVCIGTVALAVWAFLTFPAALMIQCTMYGCMM